MFQSSLSIKSGIFHFLDSGISLAATFEGGSLRACSHSVGWRQYHIFHPLYKIKAVKNDNFFRIQRIKKIHII